jgi:hypothetical protein
MWNPLVLTTLLHCFAFPAAVQVGQIYGGTVVASTATSVVWHGRGEPRGALSWLDHGLAAAWGLLDLYYGLQLGILAPIMTINAVVMGLHSGVERLAARGIVPYRIGHSAWHVVSAAKAWWVAATLAAALAAALRSNGLKRHLFGSVGVVGALGGDL